MMRTTALGVDNPDVREVVSAHLFFALAHNFSELLERIGLAYSLTYIASDFISASVARKVGKDLVVGHCVSPVDLGWPSIPLFLAGKSSNEAQSFNCAFASQQCPAPERGIVVF